MNSPLATCLAGVLALAVLVNAGWNRDAGAAVPDNRDLAAIAECGSAELVQAALPGNLVAPEDDDAAQLLAACQFTKPTNGCKKNPCDGRTYCCGGGDCITKP